MARGTAFLRRILPPGGEKIALLFGYFDQGATGVLKKVLVVPMRREAYE
jgi:hypothetical protein